MIDALTIARTEEASHAALSRNIASESVDIGAGVAAFLEPGSWVNQTWNMGLHGPVSDQELDDLVEFFNRHGVESRLPVCTLADPTLLAGLARRQFVTDAFINVFALDPATIATEDIRSADQQATDITLEIVDSTDDAQSEVFAVCTSQGFHESSPPPDAMVRTVRQVLRQPGISAVLALVGGEPVGGGCVGMSQADDDTPVVAGLFGTSVLAEFRTLGVQQALIAERVRLAHDQGAALVTIATNPGIATERNAARFGFSLSYVKAVMSRPLKNDAPST